MGMQTVTAPEVCCQVIGTMGEGGRSKQTVTQVGAPSLTKSSIKTEDNGESKLSESPEAGIQNTRRPVRPQVNNGADNGVH